MLNPHNNMLCLNLDAQLYLEMVFYLVVWWIFFYLSKKNPILGKLYAISE